MEKEKKNVRDVDWVWEKIFRDNPSIINVVENGEMYQISADEIKKIKEPRLVTKFDCSGQLPQIFVENGIGILPDKRGSYLLGKFNLFKKFPAETMDVKMTSYPNWIESLKPSSITSESQAIAAAQISPIFSDFFEDEDLVGTVCGRMGSGEFDFEIGGKSISVSNSQMEIDGALESPKRFVILEGKNVLHDDFIVRQLYYPYRAFCGKINKPIHSVFVTYSNGIFRLMEYKFADTYSYDSCEFIREKKYCLDSDCITRNDLKNVYFNTVINDNDYGAPFIQCDSFSKIISIMEQIQEKGSLTKADITEQFSFDKRQSDYYYNGCRYLGMLDMEDGSIVLTQRGRSILGMNYKERQLSIVSFILEHTLFRQLFEVWIRTEKLPDREYIKKTMWELNVCGRKEKMIGRRSQTVQAWLRWIIGLIT